MDISANAAMGYMIMAAQALELDKETIRQLETAYKRALDITSEEEAEIACIDFI